jgi:hypothetical protein
MVETGLKELGAAILAGVAIVAVSDFIFMQATTSQWFNPATWSAYAGGSAPTPAPVNPGTGGLPAGTPGGNAPMGGNGGGLPDPTTC